MTSSFGASFNSPPYVHISIALLENFMLTDYSLLSLSFQSKNYYLVGLLEPDILLDERYVIDNDDIVLTLLSNF
jgi:hypothetical protein